MHLCIISRWNASCGISLHAELIGREFIQRGFKLHALAPTIESANVDWHHRILDVDDEEWVIRCYEESSSGYGYIDKRVFERINCDILIIELYNRLPYRSLSHLIDKLDSKVVVVVHSTRKEELIPLNYIRYDAIVVFDERYINELLKDTYYDKIGSKTYIIPYPCVEPINVEPYKPSFAKGKVLFFSFGRQPYNEYAEYIEALRRLRSKYDLVYWIIRSDGLIPGVKDEWVIQWRMRPSLTTLYRYLKASDIHLVPKSKTKRVVVSSTIYQTLASFVPIVTPDTRYVETIPTNNDGIGPIVKYKDIKDLINKLEQLINDEELRRYIIGKAREFLETCKVSKIVERFIDLFKTI